MNCVCGNEMRLLPANIYLCGSCGRARWGDVGLSMGLIVTIVVVTVVLLIVLSIVGNQGEQFRQ
jgi:hypothetical protein